MINRTGMKKNMKNKEETYNDGQESKRSKNKYKNNKVIRTIIQGQNHRFCMAGMIRKVKMEIQKNKFLGANPNVNGAKPVNGFAENRNGASRYLRCEKLFIIIMIIIIITGCRASRQIEINYKKVVEIKNK
ncbi:MAG: hypothetical protein [Microviridae sp.]|nr:MAG: hypothetical protein [Microviridae sp.]